MNKNTRTMRVVSMLALLGVAVMVSLFYSPAASAANGQCKWEGGPGKATHPYCEAEDCIGNGGTAMCSAGIGADAVGGPDEDELGPDKWVFDGCDNQAPQMALVALWCTSAGGTWVTPGATCTNLPAGVLGGAGSMTNNEPQLMTTSENFADGGSCGRTVNTDTGWGGDFTAAQCWNGGTSSSLGILTRSARRQRWEGESCGGVTMVYLKTRAAKCPPTYMSRNAVSVGEQCYIPGPCCDQKVGDGVTPSSGAKANEELDYAGSVQGGLELRRTYNSNGYYRPRGIATNAPNPDDTHFSEFWKHNYERRLYTVTGNLEVSAIHQGANGNVRAFALNGTEVGNFDGGAATLTAVSGIGWDLRLQNHDVERYDTAGRLISITTRSGRVTTLAYDTCGMLETVTDAFGHALTFTNDCAKKRPTAVTLPDTGQIQYAYDQWDRLASVTYPDSTTRVYSYGDLRHQWLLTGIQDESGQAFAKYTYDSAGRISSTEHAGRANLYTLTYGTNSTTVVDPLGATVLYGFAASGGAVRGTTRSMACRDCGNIANRTYDTKGNPATLTDFNGVITQFAYDTTRNLETSRTDANGTPRARTTTTQWHSTFRIPTQIEQPGQRTNFTHDSNGNVLTRTITDLVTSSARTWTFTYDSYGRMLTANGPRSDVADTTTYAYYTCTTGNECGEVHTVENALGQVTTFNSYNANGQPLTITDPNGVVTTLTYDARQRLTSRSVAGETTTFEYWPTGLLKKTTLPDASFVQYTYDAAQRMTRIEDSAGNYIRYVLDSTGNQTEENIHDPAGVLTAKRKQVYNSLSRLWKQIGAAGTAAVTTTFAYDSGGNQTGVNAPLSRNTVNQYDELDRLKQITDPLSGVTQFGYDALDNLTSVTDPRGKVTSYQYDRFGNLTQVTSPDTGTTVNTFDAAHNLVTTTDARNKTGTYTYDALNRVTSLTYPDQTTTFTYDAGTYGKGHLTGAGDASQSLAWMHDAHGRVTQKTQIVSSVSKSVSYGYSSGQRTSMTLPSGRVVTFGYVNNRIDRISVDGTEVITDVRYQPFGPVAGWTWGNGTTTSRAYNLDGNPTAISSAGSTTYSYDNAFRITGITDQDNSARSWTYGYDLPDRLTSASRSGLNQTWTYDASGNRLTEGGTASSTYTVSTASNRLSSISGALSRTYTYADSGQVTGYSGLTFTYNDAGRLTGLSGSANATYVINALGQRVKKQTGGNTTYFFYDEDGHLIGEYDGTGALIQEIVWLDHTPVATLRDCSCGDAIFYIHTDHLDTPRRITRRSAPTVVWRWDSDPFGTSAANEDPDGDSATFAFNLRFPGQYFDAESGLNYNYFRDYDPTIGKYVQSDPIGLHGGINTYAYVENDPASYFDAEGLQARNTGRPRSGLGGGVGRRGGTYDQYGRLILEPYRPHYLEPVWTYSGQTSNACGLCLRVYFIARVNGQLRPEHSASSNRQLIDYLAGPNGPINAQPMIQAMQGPAGLRNPLGFVWHHPYQRRWRDEVWLVTHCDHVNPRLQPLLHPTGSGGMARYYRPP